jgi:hypothetical protein
MVVTLPINLTFLHILMKLINIRAKIHLDSLTHLKVIYLKFIVTFAASFRVKIRAFATKKIFC